MDLKIDTNSDFFLDEKHKQQLELELELDEILNDDDNSYIDENIEKKIVNEVLDNMINDVVQELKNETKTNNDTDDSDTDDSYTDDSYTDDSDTDDSDTDDSDTDDSEVSDTEVDDVNYTEVKGGNVGDTEVDNNDNFSYLLTFTTLSFLLYMFGLFSTVFITSLWYSLTTDNKLYRSITFFINVYLFLGLYEALFGLWTTVVYYSIYNYDKYEVYLLNSQVLNSVSDCLFNNTGKVNNFVDECEGYMIGKVDKLMYSDNIKSLFNLTKRLLLRVENLLRYYVDRVYYYPNKALSHFIMSSIGNVSNNEEQNNNLLNEFVDFVDFIKKNNFDKDIIEIVESVIQQDKEKQD